MKQCHLHGKCELFPVPGEEYPGSENSINPNAGFLFTSEITRRNSPEEFRTTKKTSRFKGRTASEYRASSVFINPLLQDIESYPGG